MINFIAPFKILDYLDRLEIVKETGSEYHCKCPVCGDGGFKIDKPTGKYHPFKCGCEVKDIREAIRPWSEVVESRGEAASQRLLSRSRRKCALEQGSRGARKSVNSAPEVPKSEIPVPRLAKLPAAAEDIPQPNTETEVPQWLQKQGIHSNATETRYYYSKNQWVSRFEWQTDKGREKTFRQAHISSNGLVRWKRGSKDWNAYRQQEAAAHCRNKWVLAVEGEQCVEAARKRAIATITWQGSNWNKNAIASTIKALKKAGAEGLAYFPDNDEAGRKKARLIESAAVEADFPCLVLNPKNIWAEIPEKGDLADWVKANPNFDSEELIAKLETAVKQQYKQTEQQNYEATEQRTEASQTPQLPNWSQSDLALWLAKKYSDRLAWNTELQQWYRYSSTTEGIWSIEPVEFVGQLVMSEVEAIALEIAKTSKNNKKPSYTVSYINGITGLLKLNLSVRCWDEATGLLPLQNGVLNLETKKLLSHSPEHKLTWCLPYDYNPLLTCYPIQQWLDQMCRGDEDLVQLMRAYLRGIVTGRTNWQKYLELVGPGGTGKSTFTRLAIALVGSENTHTTTLKKLESEKFEPASVAGKRLVLINDSERYAGEVSKLKALTGQDTLPYEVKYKQSSGGFTSQAMVIVATNEVIQSSDYTSGLERRRISIPMFNRIESDRQRNLIEHRNGEMFGEFVPYLPGLLNWVIGMDEAEATNIIKNYESAVPSLAVMKAQTLVETNPIADWLDNKVILDPEARTNIGVAKRDKDSNSDNWYLHNDEWLYPNYAEYCHDTGTRSIGLRRFVNLLSDLLNNQLRLNVEKGRDRFGSFIRGLRLRDATDDEPPLITNGAVKTKTDSSSTNVVNKLWNLVIEKVMAVVNGVMVEEKLADDGNGHSHSHDDGNNYDYNDNTLENQSQNYGNSDGDGNFEPENEEISVGDRVIIEECPWNWSWAQPFQVLAIEGNMVALELVDELVHINRLQICHNKNSESKNG
ncbi:phage/plasmid primase, P4 family [Myxosarcina sp. GI1]|uniref:phage/plasmid primase, P4 family n=1 Tax=Myxosarcina sp. GI1 TaxID=1541065 RepID=UPI00068F676D|nr:phage/plasmid primase, P4 family [Myxosarcina sp. GI1]